MPVEDLYEAWKRTRGDAEVPRGFADRVMASVREIELRDRHRIATRLLLVALATRVGRAAVCVSAGALFILRMTHLFSLFVTQ